MNNDNNREIYLRAFEIAIKESDPWCIMTSYPKVNGYHIDAQSKFLTDILRKEWNYSGLVMSDWGATTDASKSIKHGLDLEMPGPPTHRTLEAVQESLKDGETNPQDIDARVLALLKLLRQTGKLTDRKNTPQEQAISRPEHEALIRAAGAEGIVLLKNERSILPLEPKKGQKIAILGPLAKYASAHGGGSASLNCHYKMSPYEAFHSRLKECELSYSKGTHIFRVLPDLEAGCVSKRGNPGFVAELYKSFDLSGDCFYSEEYPRGSFMTLMNEKAKGAQSARFSTKFTPPTSGKHYLGFSGLGPSKLFINGELVSHQVRETRDSMSFLLGVQEEKRLQYPFESGKPYHMVIESFPSQVNNSELYLLDGQISVHLGFVEQEEMQRDILGEAIDIAKAADLAICCVGNTMQWETEDQDMESMTLPADGSQDRLIAEVAKANPNTIVVIATGVPVEMPWLKEAPAVLQAWYGGQETGNAILDVILGEVNPSGKLPISWPRKYEDTACHGHFGLDSYESREVKYVEGVKIGYRHFDSMYGTEREVLYPFGYGLSYSSFEIFSASISGNLSAEDAGAEVLVSVTVKNTSSTDGAETVQVYLSPPDGSRDHDRPPQSLVAFGKVFLKSGDLETLDLHFKRDGAAFWSEQTQRWVIESGIHEVKVSTSSSPDDVKEILSLPVSGFSFQP